MDVTIKFDYWKNEIPFRCRKPRPVRHTGSHTVPIKEITSTEAPIAIVEETHDWDDEGKLFPVRRDFRWFNNRLWVMWFKNDVSRGPKHTQNKDQFIAGLHYSDASVVSYTHGVSLEDRIGAIEEWSENVLFIDGLRWEPIGEPLYVVMTFGLGHNHGGTSLMVDYSYNNNIGFNRYFRIDDLNKAVESATQIAKARGDDKSLPIVPRAHYSILMPEVLSRKPSADHGTGCEFINRVESVIEKSSSVAEAGLVVAMFTAMGMKMK